MPTALTFDDGPTRLVTIELLDTLDSFGAKGTFFLVGSRAAKAPSIVSQILSRGHEIGNHSWSHINFRELPEGQFISELSKTHNCLYEITGISPTLLRPPYGVISQRQKELAQHRFGYSTVLWNIDTNDWKRPGVNQTASKIQSSCNNGQVVLLHDICRETVDAVALAIRTTRNPEREFVTVSKLRALFPTNRRKG